MLIDTRDLQTIQRAEFDEETKTFSILILCGIHDVMDDDMGHTRVEKDLQDVLFRVPVATREE